MLRLQRENDDLAEELVSSKVALRGDMDNVSIDCYCAIIRLTGPVLL